MSAIDWFPLHSLIEQAEARIAERKREIAALRRQLDEAIVDLLHCEESVSVMKDILYKRDQIDQRAL